MRAQLQSLLHMSEKTSITENSVGKAKQSRQARQKVRASMTLDFVSHQRLKTNAAARDIQVGELIDEWASQLPATPEEALAAAGQ